MPPVKLLKKYFEWLSTKYVPKTLKGFLCIFRDDTLK